MSSASGSVGGGPLVCCATTSEVERIASKNGVNFCQLLEAFALMPSTQAPLSKLTFRSASRHYTLVDGVKARFVRVEEMLPVSVEAGDRALHAAVSQRDSEALDLRRASSEGSSKVFERRRSEAPWVLRWRRELEKSLRYTEYEAFECPAVSLLAVSSEEPAGMDAALEELSTYLPRSFRTGQFDDRETPRFVVILHDISESGEKKAPSQPKKDSVRGKAAGVTVLPINALAEDDASAEFKRLSHENAAEIQRFVSKLLHVGVVSALEKRVETLHASVSQSRRGVRNVFKSWLRRPRDLLAQGAAAAAVGEQFLSTSQANSSVDASPSRDPSLPGPRYPAETVEAQIRLLADIAFTMRDHDTALSMYRLGRDDFKADRALTHLGSASEMIARCLYSVAASSLDQQQPRPGQDVMDQQRADIKVSRRDAIAAVDAATAALSTAAAEARQADNAENPPKQGAARRATKVARMLTRASLVAADVHASWPGDEKRRGNKSSTSTNRTRRSSFDKLTLGSQLRSPAESAADALVGAAQFETNLNAAVLYEQAAWRYRGGGFQRKCALHLVMAGHRYRACGENVHAVECYVASRDAYRETYHRRPWLSDDEQPAATFQDEFFQLGNDDVAFGGGFAWARRSRSIGWSRIDEHVEQNLGRQLESLGHHALALRCTLSLLKSARAPPDRHAALIRNFVAACSARPEALQEAIMDVATPSIPDDVRASLLEPPLPSDVPSLDSIVVLGLPLPLVLDDAVAARTADEIAADERLRWTTDLARELEVEAKAVSEEEDCVEACFQDRLKHVAQRSANSKFGGELRSAPKSSMHHHHQYRKSQPALDPSVRAARAAHWPRWCARAEPIEVDVVFKNSFNAPVDLSDVHLVCTVDMDRDFALQPLVGDIRSDENDVKTTGATEEVDEEEGSDAFLTELRNLADSVDRGDAQKPSFAAERVHVTLPPGGFGGAHGGAVVRLRCGAICRRGTLRVVGVRWRLQGAVWGAHAFGRRGPRLHRTRAERSAQARAPDASLAFHIAGDAPRLVARLAVFDQGPEGSARWVASSSPSLPRVASETLLHGEVRRACLELTNIGRSSADRIMLRCAGPWLAVGTASSSLEGARDSLEGVASGAARLGSSGLSWRAATTKGEDLGLNPSDDPAYLPVLLRARGAGGKEPMRLLVDYARRDSSASNVSQQPRGWPPYPDDDGEAPPNAFVVSPSGAVSAPKVVSRDRDSGFLSRRAPVSVDVCVLPALAAAVTTPDPHATLLDDDDAQLEPLAFWSLEPARTESVGDLGVAPMFGSPRDSVLSLQLTNYCSNGDLAVKKIRCVSDLGLSIADMDATVADNKAASVVAVDQTIGWNEQLVLHLSVAHAEAGRGSTTGKQAASSDEVALLEVERRHAAFEAAVARLERERDEENDQGPRHVSAIRRDKERSENDDEGAAEQESRLSLIVSWETAEKRSGQQHLLAVKVADGARPSRSCPVALTLVHPPSAKGRFRPPLKSTPSSYSEQNGMSSSDGDDNAELEPAVVPVVARITNRMPPGSKPIHVKLEALDDPRGIVEWYGKTTSHLKDLEPLSMSADVKLSAQVHTTGVFDLNLFKVTIFYDDEEQKSAISQGDSFLFDTPHLVAIASRDDDELSTES